MSRNPFGVTPFLLGLALLALACNTDDSESFLVDGNWQGTVEGAEGAAEITMLLFKEGKNGIAGSAQVTAPPAGQAPGEVSGTINGKDVNLTISIDEVFVGGSIVFEGAFESDDLMTGTVGSGILGGTFPVTFQRL